MKIIAPLGGVIVPLDQVPDPVFSQKMAGEGVAIDPSDGLLRAPISGRIEFLHPARHALTLKSDDGAEILLHIGIDTVEFKGDGFKTRVSQGARVRVGDPLIEFDLNKLAPQAKSLLTLVIIVNHSDYHFTWGQARIAVAGESLLYSIDSLGASLAGNQAPESAESLGITKSPVFTVENPTGLHARPAASLAALAQKFKSEIFLHHGDKKANAKSLTAIIALEVGCQSRIYFSAKGEDSGQCLEQLFTLLQSGLGESVSHAKTPNPTQVMDKNHDPDRINGICASPGLVMGTVFLLDSQELKPEETPGLGAATELQRWLQAQQQAKQNIEQLLKSHSGNTESQGIFQAHLQILADPDLLERAKSHIHSGKNAAHAWSLAYQESAAILKRLDNELLAERSQDVKDVGERVLRILMGIEESAHKIPPGSIGVARQITPSQFSKLAEQGIQGLATVEGGPSSHVGILARSLAIPMLTGLPDRVLDLTNHQPVILDATDMSSAALFLNPTHEQRLSTERRQALLQERHSLDLKHAHEPALTRDQFKMDVFANIGNVHEAQDCVTLGAEGVGLLRSEFLFLKRQTPPTESEQTAIYNDIIAALEGQPVIIRTLDVGGDKPLSYLPVAAEENPFLGVRGLRLSLARPEIFRAQLRAILRVQEIDRVRIMFPMVTSLSELIEARKILEEERKLLNTNAVEVGIMVEVPSAALMAEVFAPHVDFFSIGSNDLTQYTLAIDRGHRELAKQADGLHPAVLQLIAITAKAAAIHKKHVGVCGGIASDPHAVPILLGLGITELSVSVPSIPEIKAVVRRLDRSECQKFAAKVLKMESPEQVRAACHYFLK